MTNDSVITAGSPQLKTPFWKSSHIIRGSWRVVPFRPQPLMTLFLRSKYWKWDRTKRLFRSQILSISIPGIKPSLSPVKLGQLQVFMWAVNVSTNHRDILGWTNMLYHVHGSSRRSTGPRWSYYSRGESQFESQQYFRGDLQTFPADWGDQNRYFNPNHDVF